MATSKDTTEGLPEFELFRHVHKKDMGRVRDFLGDEVRVDPGEVLTEQGRPADQVFLVVDGTARVFVGDRAVAEIGPGESIGEMAVVDHLPRSAYVVAKTAMRVHRIPADRFIAMLDDVPTVARALMQVLSARLRKLDVRPPGL